MEQNERRDLNERIANLVEPRPPEPEGERAAELQEKFFDAAFGVGKVPLSEGGAWASICEEDEGDEPRWEARDFSGRFDLAMTAFRRLVPSGALALLYEPEAGWRARFAAGADGAWEEGMGGSAAEAVCRLLWSRHRLGISPGGAKGTDEGSGHERVFGRALDLFGGDVRAAERWLSSPIPGLGGAVPAELAKTEEGAREVEALIGRIEHGVFS